LLGLFCETEDGSDVPPKRRLTFVGLHGVIFQKTAAITLFLRITTFRLNSCHLSIPFLSIQFALEAHCHMTSKAAK
jgi:hypothetical protein